MLLLIDDGKVRLVATEVSDQRILTRVEVGGKLSDRKGVSLPDTMVPTSALAEKDRSDLEAALDAGIDWVALSFIQRPEDIAEAKKITRGRAVVSLVSEDLASHPELVRRAEADGVEAEVDGGQVAGQMARDRQPGARDDRLHLRQHLGESPGRDQHGQRRHEGDDLAVPGAGGPPPPPGPDRQRTRVAVRGRHQPRARRGEQSRLYAYRHAHPFSRATQ